MSQEIKHWLVVRTFRCWPNSLKLACHFMVGFFIYFGLIMVVYLLKPLPVSAVTVDIAQTATNGFWNDPVMRNNNLTWHNIGQSFFPKASSIDGVKVMLTRSTGTNQNDYYLDLYHGLPNLQASYISLGTATLPYPSIVESTDGNEEANFVFPSSIILIPNDPYFFRLSMASYNVAGVHSRVAWSSQIDGELLAWGALPQADNLQSGYSNLEMYFITYTAAEPLVITTASLPAATVGSIYNQTLAATGGTAPLSWSLSAGALPAGLTLSSAGVISGTPTTTGAVSFTVQLTDNAGATVTSVQTINVQALPNNAPIIAGFTGPSDIFVAQVAVWQAQASDSDGTSLIFTIDWGDGSATETVTQTGFLGQNLSTSFSHIFNTLNQYAITLIVTDSAGATATSVQTVNTQAVPNNVPVLSFSTVAGYVADGMEPNIAFKTTTTAVFRVVYTDGDNDAPTVIKLFVDSAPYDLTVANNQNGNYADSEEFIYNLPALGLTKGLHSYYFTASDGKDSLRWPSQGTLNFEVRNVPVILIPGILGTELKKGDDLLWMNVARTIFDVGDTFLLPLWMKSDGSPGNNEVSVFDVVRKKTIDLNSGIFNPLFNYFDGLITEFSNNGYSENTDLFVFPYDWRLDNRINALNLKTKIDTVLNQSSSPKVDIVAHSMGGLVTRQYILNNQDSKINTLIFLGTPHWGAPKALKALLFGDNFSIPFHLLSQSIMKRLAYNMFSVYQLLPSQSYVDSLGGYYYDYTSPNGPLAYSYAGVRDMLLDNDYNSAGLEAFESLQSQDINNIDFGGKGISAYNIVGCKKATIRAVIKRNQPNLIGQILGETEYSLLMGEGDETVPLESALGVNIPTGNIFYTNNAKHSEIPSNEDARRVITKIITGSLNPSDLPPSIRQDDSQCALNGRFISLHSPVTLDIYDQTSNHVGYNANGQLEENIPGVTYEELDGNTFVFLPNNILSSLQINLQATGTGSFNMRVSVVDNSNVNSVTYYNNVPITSVSIGNIIFDSSNNPNLQLDANNTGNITLITPSSALSGQSLTDSVAPQTSASLIGSLSSFGMYESAVEIILNAADNSGGSGVLKTVYSLDSGLTWQNYNGNLHFEVDGEYQFKYQSIDKVGNREPEKGITFRIAKPPGRGGGGSSVSQPLVMNTEPVAPVLNSPTIIPKSSYVPKTIGQNNAVTDVSDTTIKVGKVAGVSIEKKVSVSDIIGLIGDLYNKGYITKKFIHDRLIEQVNIGQNRYNRLLKVKQQCKSELCIKSIDKWLKRSWSAFQYEIGIRRGKYIKDEVYEDLYKYIELLIK